MVIDVPTSAQLGEMYKLSRVIHTRDYAAWVPRERMADFEARYAPSREGHERFVRVMNSRVTHRRWFIRVACINEKVCGFIAVRYSDETHAMVRSVFVDTSVRSQGIGSALMKDVLKSDVEYTLKVAGPNERAQAFYKRFGFTETDTPAGDFFGIPLVTMAKNID